MKITRANLDAAVARGLIERSQSEALWAFFSTAQQEAPTFKPAHILYYLGGLIAIGAMSLFMTLGWARFGGSGLLFIACSYGLLAILLTEYLLTRPGLAIPAGITAALALVMVPLAVYGAQHMMGLWPVEGSTASSYRDYHTKIDWRWLFMELATLAAGAMVLWRYRLPFLLMPIAVTLWYMSMDLAPFLLGGDTANAFSDQGKRISTGFGLAMCIAALWTDWRTRHSKDFAFWLYVFGLITFWGGLTSMHSGSELGKLIYAGINLMLIGIGAALSRRVFAVFGGIGLAFYLGHLSYSVFQDSLLFPVALTAIGLALIAAGIAWQRHEQQLGERLRSYLPASLRELITLREAA